MALLKIVCLALGLLAGSAVAQPMAASGYRGEALLSSNCSRCHAISTTGESPNPKAPHFRDLDQRYPIDSLAEALAEGIRTGHPQMPEFVFAPDEVDSIIAYLKSIQVH